MDSGRTGRVIFLRLLAVGSVAWVAACSDLGDPVRPPFTGTPVISRLTPARTVVGDTVRVLGSGFGSSEGSVEFAGAGRAAAAVVAWADDEVVVLVPGTAESGEVVVRHEAGGASPGSGFSVAPAVVTYADLLPLLRRWGCSSCHGGQNDLWVEPYEDLIAGASFHGPVVVPRRSDESLLVRVLRPESVPGVSERMPLGGAYLPPDEIQVFADFVDQGALPAPPASAPSHP